jgi:cell division septation protein DedD
MPEGKGQDDRGLSARQLILVFLAGVAVCGVFFSLGFLVGFNERSSRAAPVTEHVTAPAAIPPTVNPPPETVPLENQGLTAATAPRNAPATAQGNPAAAITESKPSPAAGSPTAPPASAASTRKTEPPAGPAPAPVAPASAGEVGVGFTVQVAASRAKEDAEALVKILKARGYPVFLVAPEYTNATDNLFRVQVGPFNSREDAEKVRTKLTQEGFKPFIKH